MKFDEQWRPHHLAAAPGAQTSAANAGGNPRASRRAWNPLMRHRNSFSKLGLPAGRIAAPPFATS